jgi:hypothetical protein
LKRLPSKTSLIASTRAIEVEDSLPAACGS